MAKRLRHSIFGPSLQRSLNALTRSTVKAGTKALRQASKPASLRGRKPSSAAGDWLAGVALGPGGARRYHLFKPAATVSAERLPLLVMLHGCDQDAAGFADSTRMNRLAAQQRFWVLYPQQDRMANLQCCWNWFDTRSGRAQAEAALLMAAIDQACRLYPIDPHRVAVAGLSAGASMAALLATRYPARFAAVVMHSGVAPGLADSSASALGAMRGRGDAPPLSRMALPPLLAIHGREDGVVAPRNSLIAVQLWATAAGAAAGPPRRLQRGQRHPMQLTDFRHRGRLAATLCEVDALGHAWSGGAAERPYGDAKGPDASRLVWAFVSRQFRRAPNELPLAVKQKAA